MIESSPIAIIGGTGLTQLTNMQTFDSQWPGTPFGEPTAPMIFTRLGGQEVIFFARHGEDRRFPPHLVNYRANLFALKEAGVKTVIAVNAVGGITENMQPEHICIPDQIIDYTHGREHTIFDGIRRAVKYIDFSQPFNNRIRQALIKAAGELNIAVSEQAVYGCVDGPRLETCAEINRMENDGCDVVGMTAMPEACLAMELELDYASVCLVVNRASGRSEQPVTLASVETHLQQGMPQVERLLAQVIQAL